MRPWPYFGWVVVATAIAVAASVAYVVLNDDVAIGVNGILAMVAGIVLTFAIAAGLMFLVFYSARRGHDDDIG